MKEILVLGAGMVCRPLVRYLLDHGYKVTVASRTVSKAEALVDGHPSGTALELNVEDDAKLEELVAAADLSVSLLPYAYHVKVGELCIKHKHSMVTTSYISEPMTALDERAREAGILILNEIGLDPGIDHMSAMRIIHDVQGRDGKIVGFSSCCGALPAHKSNTNPMGYKFSWAPRGVVMAGGNPARFRRACKVVEIPGPDLFDHYDMKTVPGLGVFEHYPNRDSMPYADWYGIQTAREIYRGTFRYSGWCETLKKIVDLGYLDETERREIRGKTYAQVLRGFVGGDGDLIEDSARHLGLSPSSAVMKRIEWLGLTGDEEIPAADNTYLDVLASRMLVMMPMEPGDIDMCVLFHEFQAKFEDGHREYITSTLVDYGIPDGDTSIARTVALPAAIAVRMILEGKIPDKGVHIPVKPGIYVPILDELESQGICCVEKTEKT